MKSNEFSKLEEGVFSNAVNSLKKGSLGRAGVFGQTAQISAQRSRREQLTKDATISAIVDKMQNLIKNGENHWWDPNAPAARGPRRGAPPAAGTGAVSENKYAKLNHILESIINLDEATGAPSLAQFVISSIKKLATDEGVTWNPKFEQSLKPMAAAIEKSFHDKGNKVDSIDPKTLENLGQWYYVLMNQYAGASPAASKRPVAGDGILQPGEGPAFLKEFVDQIKRVPLDGSDDFILAIPILATFLSTLETAAPGTNSKIAREVRKKRPAPPAPPAP